MNKLFAAASVLALLAAAPAAHAQDGARWYVMHMGPDQCVPLADVGEDLERVYYGAGHMRTPADFKRALQANHFTVSDRPSPAEGIVMFKASAYGLSDTMGLINSKSMCEYLMGQIER